MGTTRYFQYVTLPDSANKWVSLSKTTLRLFEVFDLSCLSDPAVPDVRYCHTEAWKASKPNPKLKSVWVANEVFSCWEGLMIGGFVGVFLISLLDSKLQASCKLCFVLHMHSYAQTHPSSLDTNVCVYIYTYDHNVCVCMYIYTHILLWSPALRHVGQGQNMPEYFGGARESSQRARGLKPTVSPASSIAPISEELLGRKLAGPSHYHPPALVAAVFRLSCFGLPSSGGSFCASYKVELVFYHPNFANLFCNNLYWAKCCELVFWFHTLKYS